MVNSILKNYLIGSNRSCLSETTNTKIINWHFEVELGQTTNHKLSQRKVFGHLSYDPTKVKSEYITSGYNWESYQQWRGLKDLVVDFSQVGGRRFTLANLRRNKRRQKWFASFNFNSRQQPILMQFFDITPYGSNWGIEVEKWANQAQILKITPAGVDVQVGQLFQQEGLRLACWQPEMQNQEEVASLKKREQIKLNW